MKRLVSFLIIISALLGSALPICAEETASVEGEVITGAISPAQPPVPSTTVEEDTTYESVSGVFDFPALLKSWQTYGYPDNVAGVTQDIVKKYGDELVVQHSTNQYIVLVTDTSDASVAAIREMYTEVPGITVSFTDTVLNSVGETVTMRHTYNELAILANMLRAQIGSRDDAYIYISYTEEDGKTENVQVKTLSVSIDVLSNRVVLTIYKTRLQSGEFADPAGDAERVEYFKSEYDMSCLVIKEEELYVAQAYSANEDEDAYFAMGEYYAPWEGGEIAANVDLAVAPDKDPWLFAVIALAALLVCATTLLIARRHAAPVPADGPSKAASAAEPLGESRILNDISALSEKPSDELLEEIMKATREQKDK